MVGDGWLPQTDRAMALASLSSRIVVRRLALERPALHLVLLSDGTTNLDGMTKKPAAGGPAPASMSLAIRELRVVAGQVRAFTDPTGRVRFDLPPGPVDLTLRHGA